MASTPDEIIDAALKLSDADRLRVVTELLNTLPDDPPGLSEDDPGFFEELDRRVNDGGPTIPASDLWKPI